MTMRKYDRYETQGWNAEHWMWATLRDGGLTDVKQIFAERKPNPDCAEKYDGDTPLGFAVRKGDLALAEFLIEQGAEVKRPIGYLQFSALHMAADKGDAGMVALLLKHGADPAARTRYSETPLHRAAWGGHDKALLALITAKGEVDAQSDMKQTPLHCAISASKPETVKLLLAWNADVSLTDVDGQNAKAFATKLQDMLMGSENPQLTHVQFMELARNLEKIHACLDDHDGTSIEQMKGVFNKGSTRDVSAMKPVSIKGGMSPKTGFSRF